MGGSIPQPPLLLWLLSPAKHPKAKHTKAKEKTKEKIKPENFQYQPRFPQHFGSTVWCAAALGPFGPFDGVRAAQQVVNRS